MKMKNGDEPAYPLTQFSEAHKHELGGLTKREMFAMAAMQGLLSNPAHNSNDLMGVNGEGTEIGFIAANMVIKEAITYADELLKQLSQPPL